MISAGDMNLSPVTSELNKHRVQTRIAQGGHPVAEEKISERYYRTMDYLYDALKILILLICLTIAQENLICLQLSRMEQ